MSLDDVDRYVSKLVIESSSKLNEEYERRLRARQSMRLKPKIPSMNKSFLANTLRSTNAHNQALLRKPSARLEQPHPPSSPNSQIPRASGSYTSSRSSHLETRASSQKGGRGHQTERRSHRERGGSSSKRKRER